jgi:hypothetical protein
MRFGKIIPMKSMWIITIVLAALLLLAAGCSEQEEQAGARAIEAYLQALVDKNMDSLSTLACSTWEAEARTELESFTAVSITLQDLQCQENSRSDNAASVTCSGVIVANYGNEVIEVDISNRIFKAVYEADEWRMCGYE